MNDIEPTVLMAAPYSPHRDSGGTLHLPSPTHVHSADPSSAFAQLRRTLSRSPSKTPAMCVTASKPTSPAHTSPLSPSPSSPNLRAAIGGSPLAVPFPRSARKSRSIVRRPSPMGVSQRPLSRQRSPAKRALSDCSDGGNATPSPPNYTGLGVENNPWTEPSKPMTTAFLQPNDAMIADPTSTERVVNHPNRIFSRRDRHAVFGEPSIKSSPLKRSDASCNLDLTRSGSPSAKRRSLHGATFGTDFDIFDQHAAMQATSHDGASDIPDPTPPFASPMPRRNGSLRKAALHQRHEKPSRLRTAFDSNSESLTPSPSRNRLRISLDSFPQPARESPFSSQGSLPSASAHPLAPPQKEHAVGLAPMMTQRHPLSRTITQSSSGSSFIEDSPTTVSLRQSDERRANLDFTRSLPLHATRPGRPAVPAIDSQASSQEAPFATPENYKLAKPLPQAFMSTGLISKKNKNIEQEQLDARESIGHMPDTPCKRPFSLATMSPAVSDGIGYGQPKNNRHTLHSFGTPSTPFNSHASRNSVAFGANNSVFGSGFNNGSSRRGSFLAHDITAPIASQPHTSEGTEVPPTPTKHTEQPHSIAHPQSTTIDRNGNLNQSNEGSINSRSFFESSSDEDNEGSDHWDISMSPSTRPRPHSLYGSRTESQALEALSHVQSPTPQSRFFNTVPLSRRRGPKHSALPHGVPSPVFERPTHIQLPEPSTEMLPPDPSRLSISVNTQSQGFVGANGSAFSSFFPPATPTANRDSFNRTSHKSSLTPIQQIQAAQIDESITSRFDKVELIGLGEFSSVFRGTKAHDQIQPNGFTASGSTLSTASTRIWAIKKTRNAYLGRRDRRQKLKEVDILQALGRSEHTIEFVDSWEFGQHLYIQIEYCEEGGLDTFLEKVGRRARLDDFRIWKIMLELSQGLKHIHECGVIHLDLKPANILITFEGVLKIGDFGMATFWPAPVGIEGEGDREYIAPEILRGKFDKPADIFALGLIMLEIAGNVMLPDNGVSWQRLRGGDMSDVPSLTSSSLGSQPSRDSSGCPVEDSHSSDLESFFDLKENADTPIGGNATSWIQDAKTPTHRHMRAGELQDPPVFMTDPGHEQALDKIVQWMISPEPMDRPLATDLLATVGVQWVQARRRAGATIYEGNWGPADEVLQDDAEMIDV